MEPIERKHLRVRPLATLGDQKSEVYRLTFSPDGHYLASVDFESRVCIWNITTGQLEETFISHPGPLMEQMSAASSLAWSARGDILAVGGSLYEINDYSIKLWKVEYL